MAMDTDGYHFKVDLPTGPDEMIIPVTKSCDAKFTIDRVVIGKDGEKVPVNFNSDEVFLSIDNGGETFRIDATVDANQVTSGQKAVVGLYPARYRGKVIWDANVDQ